MGTQRKLIKGKKHRKITKRKQSKPNKKHTGGAEPSKKDDNEIDLEREKMQ